MTWGLRSSTGLDPALNYYRNLDRNWKLQQVYIAQTVDFR